MADNSESDALDKQIKVLENKLALIIKKLKSHYFIIGGKAIDFHKEGGN